MWLLHACHLVAMSQAWMAAGSHTSVWSKRCCHHLVGVVYTNAQEASFLTASDMYRSRRQLRVTAQRKTLN